MGSGIPESRYDLDMPRKPSPDSRRVHMNVKFSEGEAALIDAARGSKPQGAWLREVALAAIGIPESRPLSISGFEIPLIVDERQPPGTIGLASVITGKHGLPESAAAFAVNVVPDEPPAPARSCKHKRLRMTKGVCPDCSTYVASKP